MAWIFLVGHYFAEFAGVSYAEPLLNPHGQLDVAAEGRKDC